MGNEMGNNNVSGIKEEQENGAVEEVIEKAQEVVPADEMKGENHVIPEDQTEDFHTKGELPSNDHSAANDSDSEKRKSNERMIEGEEPKDNSKSQETLTESNESDNQKCDDIQKSALPDAGNYEKPLEESLEDILQNDDQLPTPKETTVQEVERSDSTDSKTMSLEESECLVSNQIEEVPEMNDDDARYLEDKENAEKGIHGEENAGDLVPEESCITEDELPEAKTSKEKFDIMSTEDNKFGDVPENHCDGPIEYSDPSTEAALQCSSIDPIPEPQEKCVIHAEEIDLISCKSEEGENKQDPEAEQRRNEFFVNNSAPSMIHQDSSSKENREEAIAPLSSNSCLEKVHHTGETKLTHKRSRSILAGKKSCVPIEQFEDTEEVIKILPILISVSTELSSKENHDEEKRETEQTEDDSSSMPMNNDDKGTANECTLGTDSFKWENENESLLGSEDSEDRNKCTKINLEEGFANGIQNLESSSESSKTEHSKNIEETEVLSELPNGKTQESSAKLNIESNPSNQQQRSKSPSFDFGLQIDTRSEDSDQTPLLHHDKTAARSFSGFSNVRFQNRIIQTDYGRNSLDFEPVSVEEKTIRMERSDSDISRASFMNLLKKDQKKGNDQFFPQNQESPAANRNSDELSTEEIALNSPKESGKRKNRPSLFTSCICCTAVIH